MKQIGLFTEKYSNHSEMERHIKNILTQVFEDSLAFRTVYSPESPDLSECDLVLLFAEEHLHSLEPLRNHLGKLLLVTRTLSRQAEETVRQIPAGSEVLVVNRIVSGSNSLAVELLRNLMTLGRHDIRWILYDGREKDSGLYRSVLWAVHPGEPNFVPEHIPNIINLGERYPDAETMLGIASRLGLDGDRINLRLLRYIDTLVNAKDGISGYYLHSSLTNILLRGYIRKNDEALVLCDSQCRCIHCNEKAEYLLGKSERDLISLPLPIPGALSEDFTHGIVEYSGVHYLAEKHSVRLDNATVGYCVTLKDEQLILNETAELRMRIRKSGMQAKHTFRDIRHVSGSMEEAVKRAKLAAETDYPILIQGESGTGKELFAQSIHNASRRWNAPFVAVNCAAIPESLLESELFGYEGGAFTGARKQGKAGLFEQAEGGTLFLDEIGEMPASLQASLLRAIQEKQIMRVGGDRIIPVDVRILGATNQNLSQDMKAKRFREDLYYRLNTFPVYLPPLRERRDDIPMLLEHFLKEDYRLLSPEEQNTLTGLPWPGNIRQLENFCNYYKTTHTCSGFFQKEEMENTHPENRPQEKKPSRMEPEVPGGPVGRYDIKLLIIIAENTLPGHGIGRSALRLRMAQDSLPCSDSWIRKAAGRLQALGLAEIARGRGGCSITEKGRRFLESSADSV